MFVFLLHDMFFVEIGPSALIGWAYVGSTELRDFSDDDIKRVMINSKKHGMPNSECIPLAITKTEADVIVGCKCDSSRGMWYLNSVKVEVADFVHLRPEGKYNTPELVDGRKIWDAKAPTLSWVRSKEQDHVNDTKDFVEKQKKRSNVERPRGRPEANRISKRAGV